MKLHFEPNLDYQKRRYQCSHVICFVARKSAALNSLWLEHSTGQQGLPGMENELGIGNRLTCLMMRSWSISQIFNSGMGCAPLWHIFRRFYGRNGNRHRQDLCLSTDLFELNRFYGFTKFVIVVPLLPLKKVYKTLQITERTLPWDLFPILLLNFLYDSGKTRPGT